MTTTNHQEWTDQDLVDLARQAEGDMRPFESLVLRYQQRILANCRYLTRSPNDAEDLAQEVFVKAFFGLKRFEGRSKFSTWLQRIKINHCLNFNQKKKGKQMVDVETPGMELEAGLYSAANSDVDLESLDQRRRIAAVLDTMSDTLRVPLLLRDLDGLSYQEAADRMGVPVGTIMSRLHRARKRIKKQLVAAGFGPKEAG